MCEYLVSSSSDVWICIGFTLGVMFAALCGLVGLMFVESSRSKGRKKIAADYVVHKEAESGDG